ncbi:MAG TPA: serine hydrolase [Allosphingosinicella sp.]|nr:serine hydrolase [Allosphingosinicella sp.]
MRARSVILLVAACAAAAPLPLPAAAPAPRAESVANQVDRHIKSQMEALKIPGLQVAVVKGGNIVLLRSYGIASVELGVPVTDSTTFSVNSIAKAFTGVAAMRMVEAGRLDLAAPVSAYLDGLPESWRAVTVRQLLSHMSGLPEITRAPTIETDAEAAWAWVQAQPVQFPTGERFNYCQTNYTLILRILNKLAGAPPDSPLGTPQFEIAGMNRTAYGDSTDLIPGKAPSYRWTRGAAPGEPRMLRPSIERFLPFRRASSGLNSNAGDMAKWIIALRQGGLLSKASLETLWTRVPFNNGEPGQWGLGWQNLPRGKGRAVGMTGGGRAAFYLYPEQDVAVVLLTNLAGAFPEDFIDRIASLYAPGLELDGVPALRIALEDKGYAGAPAAAARIAARDAAFRWNEAELNDWGYRLLSTGRSREALEVLRLVASLFPQSGNAHDSLAEALAANGDKAGALASYRRALQLDPKNGHAERQIERLQAEAR